MSDARDVEKRWRDPAALRQAVGYGSGVIAAAGIAFAVFAVVDKGSVVLASTVPAVLFLGGVGALAKAYRVWRAGGTWPVWQGAGWFLLTLMLVCLSIPWSAAMFAG
jgi:NADH:ubiquinone oxidoreductase subunit H